MITREVRTTLTKVMEMLMDLHTLSRAVEVVALTVEYRLPIWKKVVVLLEHWKTQVLTYAIFYPGC